MAWGGEDGEGRKGGRNVRGRKEMWGGWSGIWRGWMSLRMRRVTGTKWRNHNRTCSFNCLQRPSAPSPLLLSFTHISIRALSQRYRLLCVSAARWNTIRAFQAATVMNKTPHAPLSLSLDYEMSERILPSTGWSFLISSIRCVSTGSKKSCMLLWFSIGSGFKGCSLNQLL